MASLIKTAKRGLLRLNAAPTPVEDDVEAVAKDGWRRVEATENWVSFPVASATPVEVSGGLRCDGDFDPRAVIVRVRFMDGMDRPMPGKASRLSQSQTAGLFFYPGAHRVDDLFRLTTRAPAGAAHIELSIQLWRRVDRPIYETSGVTARVVSDGRALSASQNAETTKAWQAEQAMRLAVRQYAEELLAKPGPLEAGADPFGEAMAEFLIRDEQLVDLATRLASKRLQAGRDREALGLFGLATSEILAGAVDRAGLAAFAETCPIPRASPLASDRIIYLALAEEAVSGRLVASRDGRAMGLTVGEPPAPGASTLEPHPGLEIVPMEAEADSAERASRLAARTVARARGDDWAAVWALDVEATLAGAAAADKLGLPLIYEVEDMGALEAVEQKPGWSETDAGRAQRAVRDAALAAASVIVAPTDAARRWLAERGAKAERIVVRPVVAGEPVAASGASDRVVTVLVDATDAEPRVAEALHEGVALARDQAPFRLVVMTRDVGGDQDVSALDILVAAGGDVHRPAVAAPAIVERALAAGRRVVAPKGSGAAELAERAGLSLTIPAPTAQAVANAILSYGDSAAKAGASEIGSAFELVKTCLKTVAASSR